MDWLHYAVDFVVIGFLVLMSVVAVAVAIERKIFSARYALTAIQTEGNWSLTSPVVFTSLQQLAVTPRILVCSARCSGLCSPLQP